MSLSMLYTRSRIARFALRLVAACSLLPLSAPAFAEGDAERGRVLAYSCKGCHAVDTYNNVYPTYHVPKIGGQSQEYLVEALKLYRSGARSHSTMTAQAASLSDQDIADIAAWVAATVPPVVASEPAGKAPDASQTCRSCHGATGVGEIPQYPYLAGQHEDYLLVSMRQYLSGERKGPNGAVMQAQLLSLSDADLKALARYYAKQDGLQSVPMD